MKTTQQPVITPEEDFMTSWPINQLLSTSFEALNPQNGKLKPVQTSALQEACSPVLQLIMQQPNPTTHLDFISLTKE